MSAALARAERALVELSAAVDELAKEVRGGRVRRRAVRRLTVDVDPTSVSETDRAAARRHLRRAGYTDQ